jgi:acyl carrier protein
MQSVGLHLELHQEAKNAMRAPSLIGDRIQALLAERLHLRQEEIADDASLTRDLGADSLEMAALILELEDQFDIDIPVQDAAGFNRVKELVEYVEFAVAHRDMSRTPTAGHATPATASRG